MKRTGMMMKKEARGGKNEVSDLHKANNGILG
jgi:hypothetical protein